MENQENQLNWEDWNNTSEDQTPVENNQFKWEDDNSTQSEFEWGNKDIDSQNIDTEKEQPEDNIWEDNSTNSSEEENNEFYTFKGSTNELYYNGYVYEIKHDSETVINDLNQLDLTFKNEDGRFDFSPQENSELGKVIQSIIKIGVNEHHNARILDCSVIKTEPKESFLNIFSAKPRLQFLYFAQTDQNSGDIVLDFSTLGGPSFNITKPENGTLIIFPGWIPFRVSKNNSLNDQIIISGYLG